MILLILWGEEDSWIPCEQAYLLQSNIKGSRLVTIPQAGHLVIEEKPRVLVNAIRSFLNN